MNNTPFWQTQRPVNPYGRFDAPYPHFGSDGFEPFLNHPISFQAAANPIRGSRHPWQMPHPPLGFPGFTDYQRAPAPVETYWFEAFPARSVNPRFSGPLPRTSSTRQENSRSNQEEENKVLSKLKKEIYNPMQKQMTKRLNSNYRDKKLGNEKGTEMDEDGKRCAVCLEDFEARENVMVTPCNHMFHEECILPWVKDHGHCPVCRFVLSDRIRRTPSSDNNTLNANELLQREMNSIIRAMEEAFLWDNSL
ncbi:RING-H2 finger protein ATL33-like [Hibiscus syriacus]|uniref:RING-H2 finger protein ATL33-like n=1 Tax=Hibiscus syriacus TaxID=106335 RepID=UPI00192440B7|nr:RING-H2 finger protein ATL33-like [Hibiscus syriacus]